MKEVRSFHVLDPDLDIFHNRFIEASAGTGKTFAIENIMVRLLSTGVDIERILIVTFTRAATRDLKRRIRKNIAQHQLREALFRFDEAKIFTIHGFCYHSLLENALDAGVSLEQEEEPSDTQQRALIKDYLRQTEVLAPDQWEKLLRGGIESLIDSLLPIASDHLPIAVGKGFREIHRELRALAPIEPERLFEEARYFNGMCDRRQQLKPEIAEGLSRFIRFLEGEELSIVDSPLVLMRADNRYKRAPPFVWDVVERAVLLIEELSDELAMLAHLCLGARAALAQSPVMRFDDLLIRMDQKVQENGFAEKIRARYDCVLIDEFQDTNPIQWRIFRTLFLHSGHLLYLVGDPKQAIYRFRHADIYTYMEAKRDFTRCEVLDTNYRSTPTLVTQLNQLFSRLEIVLPKTGEKIPCPPVHFDPQKEDGGGVIHLQGANEEQLFTAILNRVQRPFARNAVLVRDRYQAERFLHFAAARGIPAVSRRARSLLDSPALPLFRELLHAVICPYDRDAVLRVLGGQLYGWPLEQLDKDNPFFDYHALLRERGLFVFFRKWSADQGPALIARDEGIYQDLLQFVEHFTEQELAMDELLPFLDQLSGELPARQNSDADALCVLTIHVSKGLEFDTVFPIGLIKQAPRKRELVVVDGIYRASTAHHAELDAEEMRQLYVAFTRAQRQLYILSLKDGRGPINRLLADLSFPPESVAEERALPPAPIPVREYAMPQEVSRTWPPVMVESFSSLFVHQSREFLRQPKSNSSVHLGIEQLPYGPEVGVALHHILEALTFARYQEELPALIRASVLADYFDEVYQMIEKTLTCPLPYVGALVDLPVDHMIKEMEFLYKTERGYMKGFIDLFFMHQGKYYLADWKSNVIGPSLEDVMEQHHYYTQAEIYKEAAGRYLSQSGHVLAGCFYLFLRGGPQWIYL